VLAWVVDVAADVVVAAAVAALLLAMFVVAEAEAAFPAEAATAVVAAEEASAADQADMAVALLLTEAVLLHTAVEEAMVVATVTPAVPPMGHLRGGKLGATDITTPGGLSIHLRQLFLTHLIQLHDGACKCDRRMLQARRRQFPLADTTRHLSCKVSFSAQHDKNDR
jgi:hypothetical protein